ncbi:MAG TPA: GntR family transcriptional regulator [Bauldia sp.]|nr:GntR family transcriptional regulator [Bauldia sp.]
MEVVEQGAVGQVAYDRIRNDIIFAVLKPDERLKLEPLRVKYDTSVTTLREVLNRLASEGFVVAEGQKGFRVSGVSLAGLKEIAGLRELIECHALLESIRDGNLDWEGAVVSAHHKLSTIEQKMIDGEAVDLKLWKRFDREFHTALISARPSSFLLKLHNDIFDHYLRYQMIALGFRGKAAAEEHLMIMRYALARRGADAARVLVEHIEKGVQQAVTTGPLADAAKAPSDAA